MDTPIIERLQISQKEKDKGLEQVNRLVRLSKADEVSEREINATIKEWEEVARRLKKGEEMVEAEANVQNPTPDQQNRRQRIEDLYEFLVWLLGVYEQTLKKKLSKGVFQDTSERVKTILRS